MQSEAFRFEKSFEHSPKPSKRQNYIVFNDSNIKMTPAQDPKQIKDKKYEKE